ncbi:hypothetical protein [Deinococcus humi]|uniref:SbsA Ig-like domain-containing protein n=1 Tax=Deinococcus humi TaxID=662880 RepID=A0A7W8JUX3_9DEIO|nr:hypothetical protein [Deinococcus humi]MBB5363621.1 hypothetical protein [Deinococcus humi]GGO30008.1 hypothetical protein GCM10008949_24300 [Deinococcus humi]
MTRFRTAHLLTGIAVTLLLASCNQSTPTPVKAGTSTPSTGAAAITLAALSADSSTSLRVTFSGPVGDGSADLRHYQVTAEGGAPLEVLAAYPSADGLSVDLATRVQDPGTYTVNVSGLRGRNGQAIAGRKTVTGSTVAAPVLQDVTALSQSEVLLSFADPVSGAPAALDASATDVAAYRFTPAAALQGARLSTDRSGVVLSAKDLSGERTVAALRVLASRGSGAAVLVDPQHNQGTFVALATKDTTKPTIKRILAPSNGSVQLIFSEPMDAGAADVSAYLLKDSAGSVLPVTGSTLSEFRTSVTLTTGAQTAGASYTLTPEALKDTAGNVLDTTTGKSALTFQGSGASDAGRADTTPPRVAGALSKSTSSVLVTFSEAVRGGLASAENPANYHITGLETMGTSKVKTSGSITPQSATIEVQRARLQPGGTSVLLTTRAQSDIQYEIQVAGVQDLAGNQIAGPERGVDPGKATFTGTPVSGVGDDTDKDGLSDATEQRGWVVSVTQVGGQVRKYQVTSDPTKADTDGDGFADQDELTNATDPRLADTDSDQITDADEYNKVFSSPTTADTDGDTITDGAEANFFASSPLLADTDGDGIRDDVETLSPLRNPLIADLPTPQLTVSGVDLKLDVRFTATRGSSTRQLESKSTQTTLTQSRSTSEDYSSARTSEWFAKAGVSFTTGFNTGGSDTNIGFPRWAFSGTISTEAGGGGSTAMTFTRGSVEQSQQEYASSLTTDQEVSTDENVTREVPAAQLSAGVTFRTRGTVAFTMKNVEVTAYLTDPFAPGKLVPVATLKAEGDSGVSGISLGPASPLRGPLRFVSVQAYPAVVEQLMQNPENLVFRITNYDLTDELGRNFAYTSQQVKERTAELNIDFGGAAPAEHYNVATTSLYGDDGTQQGVSLPYLLENILKLKHVDHASDATLVGDALMNSYSTATLPGGRVLTRIRGVYVKNNTPYLQSWFINRNNTNQNDRSVDSFIGHAGDVIDLMFTEDADKDGMVKSVEDLYGSKDTSTDSDNDGVADPEEVFGKLDGRGERHPLTITAPDGTVIPLVSSPARPDSDFDGIWDESEYAARLDPSNPDTDGDGLSDGGEQDGLPSRDFFTRQVVTRFSDPRKPDTDGDSLNDRAELRIGTDPRVQDFDKVADNDRDGLSNLEEKVGWTVTLATSTVPVTSNPELADSDGDGLNDKQERDALTSPMMPDTDGDGLSDRDEVIDFKTSPTKVDTDGDGLTDFTELKKPWVPRVLGMTTPVSSSPLLRDTDYDGLTDKEEWDRWMDPTKVDTDGDQASDYFEVMQAVGQTGNGSDPLTRNKIVNVQLTQVRVDGSCDGAGDNYMELRGQFLVSTYNEESTVFNFTGGGSSGIDDHKVGETWSPSANASRTYNLKSDDGLQVSTRSLKDADPVGNPDDLLEDFSETTAYDEIRSGLFSKSVVGKAESDKTGCGVTFTYRVTWFR